MGVTSSTDNKLLNINKLAACGDLGVTNTIFIQQFFCIFHSFKFWIPSKRNISVISQTCLTKHQQQSLIL